MTDASLEPTRRTFLARGAGLSLGAIALDRLLARDAAVHAAEPLGLPGLPHFAPRAKRVICPTQSGCPSQLELFDPKPGLVKWAGTELPASVRQGQRLTTMTSGQKQLVLPGRTKFVTCPESGAQVGEWLPHLAKVAAKCCFIRSLFTDQINHAPAMTQFLTGNQIPGRPSMGAWVSYGLRSENHELPDYLAMISKMLRPSDQPLYNHYWGAGFLPSRYQGVKLRSARDAVLDLRDPAGLDRQARRGMLDGLAELNGIRQAATGDAEIATRIRQYEMAYRIQVSVPDLVDVSDEDEETFDLYTAPTRGGRAATRPTACSPDGWPSGACGSSSSSIPTGTTTAG